MTAPSPRIEGIDVVAILQHYGLRCSNLTLNQLMAWCPFHDDKRPSLSFDLRRGLWYCFGCEKRGNILTFISEIEGCSPWKAMLRAQHISHVERVTQPDFNLWTLKEPPDTDLSRFEQPNWFRLREKWTGNRNVTGQPEYAFTRGLRPSTLTQFNVMWDPQRRHMIFPVYWGKKVVGYQRRVTRPEEAALAKYRNSRGLPRLRIFYWTKTFGVHPDSYPPLLVEGVMDVLRAYQHGYANVLHCFGSKLSPIQLRMLKILKRQYGRLLICFDNNPADREAEKRVAFAEPVPKGDWEDIGDTTKRQFWDAINPLLRR